MPKQKSKATLWAEAIEVARGALSDLQELQSTYADWQDSLPENLESSATAERLQEVLDIDLDTIESILDDAENVTLPKGFGRD